MISYIKINLHLINFIKYFLAATILLSFYNCSSTKKENRINYEKEINGYNIINGKKQPIIIERTGTSKLDSSSWLQIKSELIKDDSTYNGTKNELAIIFYYPGKDEYNSTGSATRNDIGFGYSNYLQKLKETCNCAQFNYYKHHEGLTRYSKNRQWIKDPNSIFEKSIFKYNVKGSSYAIIDSKGGYIFYHGEFPYDFVISDVQTLTLNNK